MFVLSIVHLRILNLSRAHSMSNSFPGLVSLLLFLVSLTGCDAGSVNEPPYPIENGVWGNEGATLVVQDTSAVITFACGEGTLTLPILVDANMEFTTNGIMVTGPLSDDVRPVSYAGTASQNRIDITINYADTSSVLGPYSLIKNPPEIVSYICRC